MVQVFFRNVSLLLKLILELIKNSTFHLQNPLDINNGLKISLFALAGVAHWLNAGLRIRGSLV